MVDVSTLPSVELEVLGPLQVRVDGRAVAVPGAKPRAILTMLGLHGGSVVSADTLIELLWGDAPPRTAAKALQTHISLLRRTLGDGFVLTKGAGWTLAESEVDATRYKSAVKAGREAAATGDTSQAAARFEDALTLWRGIPELPDEPRGLAEKTRWIESHAALVEDRADALLATGRAAEVIGDLETVVAEAPLRERRWGQLMLALYRAGRQGDALAAYQRARTLLADQLGVDPGPELRRLEGAIVAQDAALEVSAGQDLPAVTRAVTFLLTDIEGSTAAWEADAVAMAVALARHDELVEQVVTSRGGRLIKTRGEGDATFSVFERPSAAAAAAIELQDAIGHEPWVLRDPMRVRVALHTGEVELRDGDYFGRAVNRAARLRSLAAGAQILCSGATAELVIDSLRDDVVLADLGMRQLRNLARPEHVFELRLDTVENQPEPTSDAPFQRPGLPGVLTGSGPFVGRGHELDRLLTTWQCALTDGVRAMLIAGEPGVGKTRLAGEWSQQAYQHGAVVLYGRCDEDLGAPYQPFAEALRTLVPCLGADRLRGLRGVEALLSLVPGLTDVVPDLAAPTRADPDTERYALFDAVVAVLGVASAAAPVVLILDDLHWAAKSTLLLLRHVLRFGEHARVQIVGTYRSTDVDRSHPLGAMLADLHRDGTASPLQLSGLDAEDVTAYVAEAGYDDEELARALAAVTGGNPFFLIEALRHVDENGGAWDRNTLPQGVRDAVSRRLSRLTAETNKALAAAAVVGSRFAVDLVERVVGEDLIDAFEEASKAGIVIEEQGGYYRFNHALVRQSLLAELASVRRMRLHQRIATTLEAQPGAGDELAAELAHHYFECAWAGNAAKAVEYCRRAADQAMTRLAYEGAADLYDHALHALEELDDELPDRDEQAAELLVARCEALLAAGDVSSAPAAVSQLRSATVNSPRLAAWATSFDGELSMLIHPERLDEVQAALGAAAEELARLNDAAGEAKAHTVRASCLARLGRIADCEVALDEALTAARRAREHRRVNAVLAGAPLAALWGPNPVPRAGGRCLDVVRLLRITTDSPAVEATSTRCQAVLEAFRGRAEAARRMIASARRTVTELGLRHALLEVEQFAGIVELVVDDPAAAEPHLRQAYKGFRRMGLDADTAETAALLGRACLALDRDAEADELSRESERLAGNALKASIAWRTLRAQLLARRGEHGEARQLADAAVALAERTDALVDHGDACLTLAKVLDSAGDTAAARAAAERAVELYERKGAAALAEKARSVLGERVAPPTATPPPPEALAVELDNACVRAVGRLDAAINGGAWVEIGQVFAPTVFIESHRKIVGFPRRLFDANELTAQVKGLCEEGATLHRRVVIAVQGERLALTRLEIGTRGESPGSPQDALLQVVVLDEQGRIALQVWFDVDDIDDAMAELDSTQARFEQRAKARRLENGASQVAERFLLYFASCNWDAMAQLQADNISIDDRRRVVNAGIRRGREAAVQDARANADVGAKNVASTAIATRGERLVLCRARYSGGAEPPETFHVDVLSIYEINADARITAVVTFDPDDFDAAIAELDARYLAGEAAPYAHTWSMIASGHAAVNRRELPPMTADPVSIDHRRAAAFAPGELLAYFRAGWDLDQSIRTYAEEVHRLSDLGTVCTHVGHGISPEGFNAEWRGIDLLTVDGDRFNRCEVFDEGDLDVALAKFDELSRPAPRLENAATRLFERLYSYVAAGDWAAVAQITAENVSVDDRRRVVNAGTLHGRDANIKDAKATVDVGLTMTMLGVLATRGGRLALTGVRVSGRDPEAIQNDALQVIEIDAEERIAGVVVFDLDDFDAAIAELEARYLAGEASAHARTWSIIAGVFAAHNRREVAAATPDVVSIDHRRVAAFAPGEGLKYIHAGWDIDLNDNLYIETVHRANDLGAVFTWAGNGTSHEGFDAEWRAVEIMTVDGNLVSRAEVFDEPDLDAALAKFDQLSRPAPRLENAASQVYERCNAYFAAHDWDALAETFADDISTEDRRRVVGHADLYGRESVVANGRTIIDFGMTNLTSTVLATRGERLILARTCYSGPDQEPGAFHTDILAVVESDADNRIVAHLVFDPDDFDAAIAELEARYIGGEAAAYAHAWSVITTACAALSRGELFPTTSDWVNIDHRRGIAFTPRDLTAYIRSAWNLLSDGDFYIESAHRLNNIGSVVTWRGHGTAQEGSDVEFRGINTLTVEGDLINRCEIFDEADLDVALARFEELSRPARRLENAASQAAERLWSCFAAQEWAELAETLAADVVTVDRRRVVNGGIIRGRGAQTASLRASFEAGVEGFTSTVIATRGKRIALISLHATFRGLDGADVLDVVEVDADNRIESGVLFDPDDFDAAIAELDERYLAGEAALHPRTWSVITSGFAALNRRELPPRTPNWVNIDHRRGASFAPGEMPELLSAAWNGASDLTNFIEVVHRLNDFGGVITYGARETSQEGFAAQWRVVSLLTVDGDLVNRCEVFDEADFDAAIARFDELGRPALKNAASQAYERINDYLEVHDWDAIAALCGESVTVDDRRRVVNAGLRTGRDAAMADVRVAAEVGFTYKMLGVIATRGAHLALIRVRASGLDPEAISNDATNLLELDSDGRIATVVVFDLEDIDAAFAELDTRYLAGEAAAHAHTWSVITRAFAALNRHELPATTQNFANLDHRRGAAFVPGDLFAYLEAAWDLTPDRRHYIEAVHRLNDLGAVCSAAAYGTSQEGLDAEWRMTPVLTIEGNLIRSCEIFDEENLDAALAKFDELHPQMRQLENAASRAHARLKACVAGRDWNAAAEILADDIAIDDRRRVVNSGIQYGPDAAIADMRGAIDSGLTNISLTVIATRGDRLELSRTCISGQDQPLAFRLEFFSVTEINADEQIVARVAFDPDDIDAAFEELDAKYLAGEAAAYLQTWSVIMQACAALNRREIFATTADFVDIDHRSLAAIGSGDLEAYVRAALNDGVYKVYIEAVHRLSDLGAVITQVSSGTSQAGFDGEWRMADIFTIEGDLISRCEIFDESDLDSALARFDELHPQTRRLENTAARVNERFFKYFTIRDWVGVAQIFADDIFYDDRRRVVNGGCWNGRDLVIENMRAITDFRVENLGLVATRGECLSLGRWRWSNSDQMLDTFHTEVLCLIEVDTEQLIAAIIVFDPEDIAAAIAELDTRYLAGEAAAHAHTWSLMAGIHGMLNRHEIPPTAPGWVNIDHRRGIAFAPGDLVPYVRDTFDDMPDVSHYILAVHRLSDLGAVITQTLHGTSRQGLDAEWQNIGLFTFEGDLANRVEIFDEADLDTALARFEELHPQTRRVKNAASQVFERFVARWVARDWDAVAEMLADDIFNDDRRRVVNAGLRHGRDATIASMRASAAFGLSTVTSLVIATRGERLALSRDVFSIEDGQGSEAVAEVLGIIEIDTDERIVARLALDLDDIDAAFEELDARYLAGEAAAHADTWSVVAGIQAAVNRRELPAMTQDPGYIDHRPLVSIEGADLAASIRAIFEIHSAYSVYVEAVHRLDELGAVYTQVHNGTSHDGVDAEWRIIEVQTVEGDLLSRAEVYDEADLDTALARFDELHPQTPRLENAAIRASERLFADFAAGDWDAVKETLADNFSQDDRRRVVGAGVRHGRDEEIADLRAIADLWTGNAAPTYIATRGERLALMRLRFSVPDQGNEAFLTEVLGICEINGDERIVAAVSFDSDDIGAAFEELDARYLAGEAAEHQHMWSVIAEAFAGFNRHELPPTTPDPVYIDHRPLVSIEGADYLAASLRTLLDITSAVSVYIEALHRLTERGAVTTQVVKGTWQEGSEVESRMITIFTVERDLISGVEVFDETDLDVALARFGELDRPAL